MMMHAPEETYKNIESADPNNSIECIIEDNLRRHMVEEPRASLALNKAKIRKSVKTFYMNNSTRFSEFRGASRNCDHSW